MFENYFAFAPFSDILKLDLITFIGLENMDISFTRYYE